MGTLHDPSSKDQANPFSLPTDGKANKSKLTAYFTVRRFLSNPAVACSAVEANVLLLLAGFADPNGTQIIQSYDSIVQTTRFGKASVRRAIETWLSTGVLILVKAGRYHDAPQYRINLDLVLKDPVESAQGEHPKSAPSEHPQTGKGDHLGAQGCSKGAQGEHLPSLPSKKPAIETDRQTPPYSPPKNGGTESAPKREGLPTKKMPRETLAWCRGMILARAKGIIHNQKAYFEKALPEFLENFDAELDTWLARQALQYINAAMVELKKRTPADQDPIVPWNPILQRLVNELGVYKLPSTPESLERAMHTATEMGGYVIHRNVPQEPAPAIPVIPSVPSAAALKPCQQFLKDCMLKLAVSQAQVKDFVAREYGMSWPMPRDLSPERFEQMYADISTWAQNRAGERQSV